MKRTWRIHAIDPEATPETLVEDLELALNRQDVASVTREGRLVSFEGAPLRFFRTRDPLRIASRGRIEISADGTALTYELAIGRFVWVTGLVGGVGLLASGGISTYMEDPVSAPFTSVIAAGFGIFYWLRIALTRFRRWLYTQLLEAGYGSDSLRHRRNRRARNRPYPKRTV